SVWGLVLIVVAFVAGIAALAAGAGQRNPEFRAMSFFGGGAVLLAAALMLTWRWLKSERGGFAQPGPLALPKLGASNARRFPVRSLLTAGLLSSAAFLLVAVESFRRQPEKDFAQREGGSGGFSLIVETDVPVYREPSGDGRNDLLDAVDAHFQRQ